MPCNAKGEEGRGGEITPFHIIQFGRQSAEGFFDQKIYLGTTDKMFELHDRAVVRGGAECALALPKFEVSVFVFLTFILCMKTCKTAFNFFHHCQPAQNQAKTQFLLNKNSVIGT